MSLANKTLGGFLWAFSERFGIQAIQLVIFIILARLLSPEAFGLIAMLTVFIAVSQSLTDSGFGQALIQKKDADEIDFSSVFYINLIVSVIIYGILFVSAPLIADFYGETQLIVLVRVLGLKFMISAFYMVQVAKLTKEVNFKSLMIARLPSTLLGGILGVLAAYSGYGVWSLVIQQLANEGAYAIQVWVQSQWRPVLIFRWQRIKGLFDFGGKMMIEGVLSTLYGKFYEIMIGRYYPASQVGFYSQANKIKQLPVQNISSALNRVTFPILSEIQGNDKKLKSAYKKIIRQVFFIISPIMLGAIVLAEPLFRLVLTEKWLPAVPYFQWLCVTGLFHPVNSYNLNILKVKGRSDLFLYLGLVKKTIAIVVILILVQYSVMALVIFQAVFAVLGYGINSFYSGKFIDYNIFEQLKDVWKFLFISIFISGMIWLLTNNLTLTDWEVLLIGSLAGSVTYISMIYLFEKSILDYSLVTIKKYIRN